MLGVFQDGSPSFFQHIEERRRTFFVLFSGLWEEGDRGVNLRSARRKNVIPLLFFFNPMYICTVCTLTNLAYEVKM